MTALASLVAHQGGWDEVLLVAAPLSLFAGLLYLANRRADRLVAHRHDHPPADEPDGGDPEG